MEQKGDPFFEPKCAIPEWSPTWPQESFVPVKFFPSSFSTSIQPFAFGFLVQSISDWNSIGNARITYFENIEFGSGPVDQWADNKVTLYAASTLPTTSYCGGNVLGSPGCSFQKWNYLSNRMTSCKAVIDKNRDWTNPLLGGLPKLRRTILQTLGGCLGLGHARAGETAVMRTGDGPEASLTITSDDVAGLQALYGVNPDRPLSEDYWYSIEPRHVDGLCVDVLGISTEPGANIIQSNCHYGDNQLWRVRARGDGYYEIIAKHSNQCVDVYGGQTFQGADIVQAACHGGDNQQFRFVAKVAGRNTYQLVARHSGMCMDVSGAQTGSGADIVQAGCHGGANQLFKFNVRQQFVPSVRQNVWYIVRALHSGLCMDVYGASTAHGADIVQANCHGGDNQLWRLVRISGEFYELISRGSGMCVDVYGAYVGQGVNIVQATCHGQGNQQFGFLLKDLGNNVFQLVIRHSGMCVDVMGAQTSNGADIVQAACHGGANQLWRFEPVVSF